MTNLEFVKCMKRLSSFYLKDITPDTVVIWYEFFKDIPIEILNKAIDDVVKESKFMPNVNELLARCKKVNNNYYLMIVERMYHDGYFRKGFKELDQEHENRNYDKTMRLIEKGIIPEFLKEDMKSYMNEDERVILGKTDSFLIE